MKKASNILWGLLFIAIGIVWILNVTGIYFLEDGGHYL